MAQTEGTAEIPAGAGVPEASALLVKPENTANATVPPEAARRVEVVVK